MYERKKEKRKKDSQHDDGEKKTGIAPKGVPEVPPAAGKRGGGKGKIPLPGGKGGLTVLALKEEGTIYRSRKERYNLERGV